MDFVFLQTLHFRVIAFSSMSHSGVLSWPEFAGREYKLILKSDKNIKPLQSIMISPFPSLIFGIFSDCSVVCSNRTRLDVLKHAFVKSFGFDVFVVLLFLQRIPNFILAEWCFTTFASFCVTSTITPGRSHLANFAILFIIVEVRYKGMVSPTGEWHQRQ